MTEEQLTNAKNPPELPSDDHGHGHYGGQKDHTLHFGLGRTCTATVSVRCPNEGLSTESFTLEAGSRYLLRQGESPEKLP